MQIVQRPQSCAIGTSGSTSTSSNRSPRSTHDPRPGTIRQLFLPNQPMPARWATVRSEIIAVSTRKRASTSRPRWSAISSRRRFIRFLSTTW